MFLAFPSSEVFYVVAIVLTWLYIALGLLGNYQANDQVSSFQNNQVQEHQISFDKSISSDSRTFYWLNNTKSLAEKSNTQTITCNYYFIDKIKYRNRDEYFRSSYLNSSIPDRAPPSF